MLKGIDIMGMFCGDPPGIMGPPPDAADGPGSRTIILLASMVNTGSGMSNSIGSSLPEECCKGEEGNDYGDHELNTVGLSGLSMKKQRG